MLNFQSHLAPHILHFIELRRLGGTDYASQTKLLSYFDRFLVEHDWHESVITPQIIDDYQCSLSSLAPRTRGNRCCAVRHLCEYLGGINPQSYVPEIVRNHTSDTLHKPYIYTIGEIQALMDATATLIPTGSLKPHTYRTLLGLLYTTGIRIGEAIALNQEDFYAEEQRLFIADGKFHKARWIPLAPSTCTAITAYLQKRCQYDEGQPPESSLFINLGKCRLTYGTVSKDFRRLLDDIGIRTQDIHPHLHDLRHTFAVSRLLDWYQADLNVNALLPALANAVVLLHSALPTSL